MFDIIHCDSSPRFFAMQNDEKQYSMTTEKQNSYKELMTAKNLKNPHQKD